MSTINDLREKLMEDARKRAEEIIREAEKKAEEIIREAEKEYEKKAEKTREKILEEARINAQIIISDARRKSRLMISEAKYEIIRKVFEEAWQDIINRKNIDIETSLKNLLLESLEFIEKPDYVEVNEKDKEIINKILIENNISAEIRENNQIAGGLITGTKAGEKVDNSYDTRFERAKSVLLPLISKILWG